MAEIADAGWRLEITRRGTHYHWRRGSKEAREYLKGGQITDGIVTEERKAEYHKRANARRRTAARKAGTSTAVPKLPGSRPPTGYN